MLGGCLRTAGGIALAIGGMPDHVHILAALRATHRLADVVRDLKRITSHWVEARYRRPFAWQEGYGAFTVCPQDRDVVARYIRTQAEHRRTVSFQDEYRRLLIDHDIAFDERFLW